MKELVNSFSQYTGVTAEDITKIMGYKNEKLVDQLREEIEENSLITWEHDSDGDRPNIDNLIEWIGLYYRLEETDACKLCGDDPMTVNCNNANCS